MSIVTLRRKNANAAVLLENTVLLLVSAAPLIIPFGLVKNIGLQAMLICLTGVLAWAGVFLRGLPKSKLYLAIFAYIAACLLSFVANPNLQNLVGTSLTRLGSLELLACVGIGLALSRADTHKLLSYLYGSACLTAAASILYGLFVVTGFERLGGVFFQPDFLAVIAAVGFIIGNELFLQSSKRFWLLPLQLSLLVTIFLTQTRALIILTPFISLLQVWLCGRSIRFRLTISVAIVLSFLGGIAISSLAGSQRISDTGYAGSSVSYRLDLLQASLTHIMDRPLQGYGAGSIEQALPCSSFRAPSLQQTCADGYYFNSSHNIFIDRFLMMGWLGGISFISIIGLALQRGIRSRKRRIYALLALLIALYYLTNTTAIQIEVLLWIFVGRIFIVDKHKRDRV